MAWQPIETAPNPTGKAWDDPDWKSFLVWVPGNKCVYLVSRRNGEFAHFGGMGKFHHEPSHWMPLPDPPAS